MREPTEPVARRLWPHPWEQYPPFRCETCAKPLRERYCTPNVCRECDRKAESQ